LACSLANGQRRDQDVGCADYERDGMDAIGKLDGAAAMDAVSTLWWC